MSNDWTKDEFSELNLGDARLLKRFIKTLKETSESVSLPFSAVFDKQADLIGTYRLINNEKISYSMVLNEHSRQALKRMEEIPFLKTVLAIQDTTSIDLTTKYVSGELGSLEKNHNKGFFFHPTLLLTTDDLLLGIINTKLWTRKKIAIKITAVEKRKKNLSRSIEEKETYRWFQSYLFVNQLGLEYPQKQFVSIGDRESDFIELLVEACKEDALAKIIIRAAHDRRTKTINEDSKRIDQEQTIGSDNDILCLWDRLLESKAKTKYDITLGKTGKREKRDTVLEVRCQKVKIVPPKYYKNKKDIYINAVYVKEKNDLVAEKDLIEWMLLTTLPINTNAQLQNIISFYKSRWKIEIFFRLLKTGCKIESHHFKTSMAYLNCIALKIICAWRLMYINHICLNDIDIDPKLIFTKLEMKIIKIKTENKKLSTIRDYIRALACMGGFKGGSNKNPGYIYIGQGFQKLSEIRDFMILIEYK